MGPQIARGRFQWPRRMHKGMDKKIEGEKVLDEIV
jgi:hypothetical protein